MTDTEELQRQQMFRRFKQLKRVSTCIDALDAGIPFTHKPGLKKKELHPKKAHLIERASGTARIHSYKLQGSSPHFFSRSFVSFLRH